MMSKPGTFPGGVKADELAGRADLAKPFIASDVFASSRSASAVASTPISDSAPGAVRVAVSCCAADW